MNRRLRLSGVLLALGALALISWPATVSARTVARHDPRPTSQWVRNGWLSARNKELSGQFFADRRALQRMGIRITQWGPDSVSGKLRIYLTHYSRAAARALYNRYGQGILVSTRSMPRPAPANRSNNSAPFFGGDFINILDSLDSFCTGGPVVLDASNADFMLTAGHCVAELGAPVFTSDPAQDQLQPMGTVTERSLCDGCLDVALITPNTGEFFNPVVWGGQDSQGDNEPAYQEDGPDFPSPSSCPNGAPTGCAGDTVTSDGAVTGEVEGITVFAVDQSVTFTDGITRTGLSEACSDVVVNPGGGGNGFQCADDGPILSQEGDSGGPWITHEAGSNFNVHVAGIDSGSGLNGHVAFYEQIGNIDALLGVHVPPAFRARPLG